MTASFAASLMVFALGGLWTVSHVEFASLLGVHGWVVAAITTCAFNFYYLNAIAEHGDSLKPKTPWRGAYWLNFAQYTLIYAMWFALDVVSFHALAVTICGVYSTYALWDYTYWREVWNKDRDDPPPPLAAVKWLLVFDIVGFVVAIAWTVVTWNMPDTWESAEIGAAIAITNLCLILVLVNLACIATAAWQFRYKPFTVL